MWTSSRLRRRQRTNLITPISLTTKVWSSGDAWNGGSDGGHDGCNRCGCEVSRVVRQSARRGLFSVQLVSWVGGVLLLGLSACSGSLTGLGDDSQLNSRFSETQPAISGNGQFVAMISNRGGNQALVLYDLQQQRLIELPQLNRRDVMVESPSLSRSARYIVYVVSEQGRSEIALYDRLTQRQQLLTLGLHRWVRNPSISPDGRYVAFESGRRGQWDIEVLDRGAAVPLDLEPGAPNRGDDSPGSGAEPGL